jgi:hypothetical protein
MHLLTLPLIKYIRARCPFPSPFRLAHMVSHDAFLSGIEVYAETKAIRFLQKYVKVRTNFGMFIAFSIWFFFVFCPWISDTLFNMSSLIIPAAVAFWAFLRSGRKYFFYFENSIKTIIIHVYHEGVVEIPFHVCPLDGSFSECSCRRK